MIRYRFVILLLLLIPHNLLGMTINDIASCYDVVKLPSPSLSSKSKELFVAIDQTTLLDNSLQQSLIKAVESKLNSETKITIITFSAFIGNHYLQVIFSGSMDRPYSQIERDEIAKPSLRKLDNCMIERQSFMRETLQKTMIEGFGKITNDTPRSEIISSLQDVANSLVKPSQAEEKLVLVISDMIENSALSSFYSKNSIRQIEPEKELNKLKSFGDFDGAKIFVAGAGTIDSRNMKQLDSYRDTKTMNLLEEFWRSYFIKSNGKLLIFGKPTLLGKFE